jgi:hypothetical protein
MSVLMKSKEPEGRNDACRRFLANQVRLFIQMATYWIALGLREALTKTEFASL